MRALVVARRMVGALAAAALLAAATPAAAAMVSVRPETLIPVNPNGASLRWAAFACSAGASSVLFWAPLPLPVGSTITGLTYYHWGDGVAKTNALVTRARIGAAVTNADMIFFAESSALAPDADPPQTVSTVTKQNAASDTTVRAGYRYYVLVGSATLKAKVAGVRVLYQP